jgi:hypothetical protein
VIAFHSWRSSRQLKGAEGFIGGYLGSSPKLTLWTVTVWKEEAFMRAYRNAPPHLGAMPKLIGSCDEASVVHWTTHDAAIPSPPEVAERMKDGRTSKLHRPTPEHAAGNPWPDRKLPFRGPSLNP